MPDEQALKNEMQGSDGFLAEFKEDHIPDSSEMSERALEKYEDNNSKVLPSDVKADFSDILMDLISIETRIFEVRTGEVYPEAMAEFLQRHYNSGQAGLSSYANNSGVNYAEYPETQKVFEEIADIFNAYNNFDEAFERIFPLTYHLMKPICESEFQSAGKRAGLGFKNHVIGLIEIAGFTIRAEERRDNGYVIDIQEPGGNKVEKVYFGFHTTLRDRFRQSFSDAPVGMDKYLVTGLGAGAYQEDDAEDLTRDKIDTIRDAGFSLVVLDHVENRFSGKSNVLSYENLVNTELPRLF